MQKLYFINNATDQIITITQGSGNSVTVPVGTKKIVYCDGAGGDAAVTDLTENLSLSGEVNVTTLKINGAEVTADAAEINTLDGLSASTAELNVLDGITSTTAELNKLDGFTGGKDDLNYAKDLRATGVSTTEFERLDGLTASTGELNTLDGVVASTAELNTLDGFTGNGADLNYAKDLRATGVTTTEFNKLDGLTASTSELNVLDGITATTSELNKVDGFTGNKDDLNYAKDLRATGVTTTEFNKLDGVTSGIQSQLNSLENDKAEESITISAGGGLSGGGSLAANRTISHADTSSQGSVNNSGNTVVQDITVDTYGHVTNINSKTVEPMPVGATFIQFPGYSAPNSLFGGSWSAIFDNEGIFFRTPGSGASSFGGGIQGADTEDLFATFDNRGSQDFEIRFISTPSWQANQFAFDGDGDGSRGSSSTRSRGLEVRKLNSGETRPRNRTVRVWVRTA
jgi:hypothetical protein